MANLVTYAGSLVGVIPEVGGKTRLVGYRDSWGEWYHAGCWPRAFAVERMLGRKVGVVRDGFREFAGKNACGWCGGRGTQPEGS